MVEVAVARFAMARLLVDGHPIRVATQSAALAQDGTWTQKSPSLAGARAVRQNTYTKNLW